MTTAPEDPLLLAFRACGQLSPDQLSATEAAFAASGGAYPDLADKLSAAAAVTRYQYRKIQLGRTADLLFGKYLIMEKIGEGGMGKVYRAAETDGRRRLVALKTIRPQLMANKTVLSRYKREAKAAAALDHPNIVKLYDADDFNGRYYIAMEFVEGSDLSRLNKELVREKRPMTYPEAVEYVRQAAAGLQHAHDRGLVHRDIKPSNLLVYGERAIPGTGGKAMVKILDMGLVRSLADDDSTQDDLTRDGTVVGTPDYMSPEQAKNSSTVDHRADLYSLGCTLFYLLRGQPPFPDGSSIDKLIRHQLDPVPDIRQFRPDVPPGLAGAIRKLMAKKPDERYQTGGEAEAALVPFTPDAATLNLALGTAADTPGPRAFAGPSPFESVDLAPPPPARPASSDSDVLLAEEVPPQPEVLTTPPSGISPAARPLPALPVPQPPSGGRRPTVIPKPKAIPKRAAAGDASTADNLPGASGTTRRTARGRTPVSTRKPTPKPRKKGKKFPFALLAVAGVVAVTGLVVAAVLMAANHPPVGGTDTGHGGGGNSAAASTAATATRRPVFDLIPDDTTGVVLYHPADYFARSTSERTVGGGKAEQAFEHFARWFKFDPRVFDRGTATVQQTAKNPRVTHAVGTGEGDFLAKPDDFRAGLEGYRRFELSTLPSGVIAVKPKALAGTPAAGRVRAAVLPAPPAYVLANEGTDLKESFRRNPGGKPTGVQPDLMAAVEAAAANRPLAFVAASRDYRVPPPPGEKVGERLEYDGVHLLTATVRLNGNQFFVELGVVGKSKEQAEKFLNVRLPELIDGHVGGDEGRDLVKAVHAVAREAVGSAEPGGGYRLTVTVTVDWTLVHAAADKLVSVPSAPPVDR